MTQAQLNRAVARATLVPQLPEHVPGLRHLIAGNRLTVDNLAILNPLISNYLRVPDKFISLLEYWHYLANIILSQHLVSAPHLAGDAAPHSIFASHGPG